MSNIQKWTGMIGMGLMGSALAERLSAGGFKILAFDVIQERTRRVEVLGGQAAASAEEVFSRCDHVLVSLPDSGSVGSMLQGVNFSTIQSGTIVIDTTTGKPECSVEFNRMLSRYGVHYLDATISGSSNQVRQGKVMVMVGGETEPVEDCVDLFTCFAARLFHTGPTGSGSKMKLICNLVLGLNEAALAEGLYLAEKQGLDLDKVLEILQASMAYSRVMDNKGPRMIHNDHTAEARLSQHLKDVRLMMELGENSNASLPMSETHKFLLETAERKGWGDLDNSAIIRVFRECDLIRKTGLNDPKS